MLSARRRRSRTTNARVGLVSPMPPPRPRSTYQNADGSEFGALSDSDWSPPSIGGRGEGGSAQSSRFAVIADQLESRRQCLAVGQLLAGGGRTRGRSEEHTSELQSQSNLVCRLLLGKPSPPD